MPPVVDRASARRQFCAHRSGAKSRGIEWLFDLDSWIAVWGKSGMLHARGKRKDQYVMARFDDIGPYAPWNVRIIPAGENIRESVAIQVEIEKMEFYKEHGFTVLDWLKNSIDWHVKVAPLKMQFKAEWPEVAKDAA